MTIELALLILAFVLTLLNAISKLPPWPALLVICIVLLIRAGAGLQLR